MLSKCHGPQVLVTRLSDSRVYCWDLDCSMTEIVNEQQLVACGGLIATSKESYWVAVANADTQQIEVWACGQNGLRRFPVQVSKLNYRPTCLAVTENSPNESCLLALAEDVQFRHPLPPIQVFIIHADGSAESLYQIPHSAVCRAIMFLPDSHFKIVCVDEDGVIVVQDHMMNLTIYHDSPSTRTVDICADGCFFVSSASSYFHVFQLKGAE